VSRRGGPGVAGLTPLLDTLFLLLFALLALTQSRTTGRNDTVRVELPAVEPGSGANSADVKSVRVHVDAQGIVSVEGRDEPLSSLAELDPALSAVLGDAVPEAVRVDIVADDAAPYGVAVTLLQHLRLAGFSQVGLLARKEDLPSLPGRER
jgi:biopolymer transport protein ExbD